MSARLLRKVLEEQQKQQQQSPPLELEPEEAIEDDDALDSSISAAPYRNPFDLLDNEDSDEKMVDDTETEKQDEEHNFSTSKIFSHEISSTSKSKKKKNKKKKNKEDYSAKTTDELLGVFLDDSSLTSRSLNSYEVGKRSEDQFFPSKQKSSNILSVNPKFLKAENELRKIFGSKVVDSFENSQSIGSSRKISGGRRTTYNLRKQLLISAPSYWPKWDGSLYMELVETKNGVNYFRYEYSQSFVYLQELFEDAKASHNLNAIAGILAHHPYHTGALLLFAEAYKFSGEHQLSAEAIAKCLFALECAWHPLFNPVQGNCQLKYYHETNKPFFKVLFNHMKNMDRRGCHRSALEVCKLLLSLDSDDPVGTLFFVDYLSIRAQEFSWLEQFSEEYDSENSILLFPNFSYSLAISYFYLEQDATCKEVDRKNRATASELMQQAIMLHPLVVKKLVDKAPLKDPCWTKILMNPFFCSAKAGGPTLDHLIDIYVERNYIIWRYPELQNFLKESSLQVIELLKQNTVEVKNWSCIRKEAFPSEKNEYSHLLISDFSHTIPSIPPEEVRQFMVGAHGVAVANDPLQAQPVREVG